jgi:diaminohydroxyphosphoribosylaminopyrimidine deaminase/5-amino-6-(5-phosphoribosylamino)uracil reductase
LKIAASLDGRTALNNGASQWITGEAARADGHEFRRRASAVLTGIGTVLEDNPRLDVRLVSTRHQPLRVVVDSRLQTPPHARILQPPGEVLLYAAAPNREAETHLNSRGAKVCQLGGAGGKVDLPAMLADLAQRGVNELHVEAGHKLNASLLREGLVDELLVYVAPMLLGLGRDMAAFGPLHSLADALHFRFTRFDRIGDDLRILARSVGRDAFGAAHDLN